MFFLYLPVGFHHHPETDRVPSRGKEVKRMERKILLAFVAKELKGKLDEFVKYYDETLESLGGNVKEAQLLFLDIIIEACQKLKAKIASEIE